MQFTRKRISKLLLSCKTSNDWEFQDIQVASVLITGLEINESEFLHIPLNFDSLIEYFYNRQPSELENLFNAFNQLDIDNKGYITCNDLQCKLPARDQVASRVASHYNSRPQAGRINRQKSNVFHLRALNNWIKSQLISTHTKRGDKVLDLCCGKGGDLLKWDNAKVSQVIGIDIAAVSIEQAKDRYNNSKKFMAEFHAGDVFANDLSCFLKESDLYSFDIVSCQFALHYSFETVDKATRGLRNISKALKKGGKFIATIPNSNWIVKKLRSLPSDQLEFGNEFYKIRFEQKNEYPLFGHCYWFALEDAIDDCPEYLIHLPTLKKLAESVGLELVHYEPFHSYFYNSLNDSSFDLLQRMKVLDRDGSFSKQEWEIAGVYMTIVFKKL